MKTISLKTKMQSLSRDQMRMILGSAESLKMEGGCKGPCDECSGNGQCCSGVCARDQPGCGGGRRCLK